MSTEKLPVNKQIIQFQPINIRLSFLKFLREDNTVPLLYSNYKQNTGIKFEREKKSRGKNKDPDL